MLSIFAGLVAGFIQMQRHLPAVMADVGAVAPAAAAAAQAVIARERSFARMIAGLGAAGA